MLDKAIGSRRLVILLALASAAAAVLVSHLVYPHLSINNDEPVYRLQADAIAHGHLLLPGGGMPGAFRPWLSVVQDGHYVLKYPPFFPAMLAVSQILTGGPDLLLATMAAAAVVTTWLLARELLDHKTAPVVAAAIVALSPLMFVQRASLLPYVVTFVLLELFAWGAFRGLRPGELRPGELRTGRLRPLTVSGAAIGLTFAMRPLDAVLFGLPIVAWALFARRGAGSGDDRLDLRRAIAFAAPAAAGLAALLVTNLAMTGNPFRLPFGLLEPQDKLGFGPRKLFPSDPVHDFGPAQGLLGLARHGLLLNWWLAGGTILLGLALVALVRTRPRDPLRWLAASGAAIPLGYIGFWGPWNATVLWGGTRYVGPFYFLPVLIPVALLGAHGLCAAYRHRQPVGVALVGAMAVLTVATTVHVVGINLDITRRARAIDSLVERATSTASGDSLVIASMPEPYLLHPGADMGNSWDLSGRVLYAVARGDADVEVATLMNKRALYRLVFDPPYFDSDLPLHARVEQVRLQRGPRIDVTVVVHSPTVAGPGRTWIRVSSGGTTKEYSLGGEGSGPSGVTSETLVVSPEGATLASRIPDREYPQTGSPTAGRRASVTVELIRTPSPGATDTVLAAQDLPNRIVDRNVMVLVPTGASWVAGPKPAEASALELRSAPR